jgi:hypothetical protein
VTPDITQIVGTNPNNGDKTIKVEVNTQGAPREFIRLNVVQQ